MMYAAGLFDVDYTTSATTTTKAVDRSTRSRSAERDKVAPVTTTTPDSTGAMQTTASATGTTEPPSDTSSRQKSGIGAKGRWHIDFSTSNSVGLRTDGFDARTFADC